MPKTSSPASPRAARFSAADVFALCQKFVYPPCKKLAGFIELPHRLGADLGYSGESLRLLALKTNQVFRLSAPDHFSSLELTLVDTVREHVAAICTKLGKSRRFIGDEQPPGPSV